MNLNRRIILFIILLSPLLASFSFFKSKSRDYADIAREIRAKVGNNLAKRHKMDLIGVSGGMMGSVYMIGLCFQIHHLMDRTESRERIVDCVEELINAVNSNEEIRPFLKNYPFTTKNVKIVLFIRLLDGRDVFHPNICIVSVDESDDIIFYTKESNTGPYKSKTRESYAEALTMIKGNKKRKNNGIGLRQSVAPRHIIK